MSAAAGRTGTGTRTRTSLAEINISGASPSDGRPPLVPLFRGCGRASHGAAEAVRSRRSADPMPRSIYRHCQCAALFILMCLFLCRESDRDGLPGWPGARQRPAHPLKSIRFPIRRQLFLGEMETWFELPSPWNAVSTVCGTRTRNVDTGLRTNTVPAGTPFTLRA